MWFSGLLLSFTVFSTGCATLCDFQYEQSQKLRAYAQYSKCNQAQCSKYPRDYKKGWVDGFYEVATGGSCCPPAVAPSCYWSPNQIIEDCDNRRHAYYSGWQDGASRASQFPDTHFVKIFETCECPFPRCECPSCGSPCATSGPCQCGGGGCQSHVGHGGGMVYDAGTIEADREIMMVPIPDEPSSDAPAPIPTPPVAAASKADDASDAPPIPTTSDEPQGIADTDTADAPPAVDSADLAELEKPVMQEPASSSDGQLPPPENLPLPTKVDGISAPLPTKMKSDRPRYTYDFGADNSLTIDFVGLEDVKELGDAQTTVLSDFDIQLDGVGLIE